MQFDSTHQAPSSTPDTHPVLKRSFAQQATATAPSSSKVPRVDSPQPASPFSFSRKTTFDSPPFEMPPSSHNLPSRPSRGIGSRPPQASGHASSSRLPKRGRGRTGPPRKIFEGPFHDEAYIKSEYQKSTQPIKSAHEATPKSALGNFAMVATGKLPVYKSSDGYVGDALKSSWR